MIHRSVITTAATTTASVTTTAAVAGRKKRDLADELFMYLGDNKQIGDDRQYQPESIKPDVSRASHYSQDQTEQQIPGMESADLTTTTTTSRMITDIEVIRGDNTNADYKIDSDMEMEDKAVPVPSVGESISSDDDEDSSFSNKVVDALENEASQKVSLSEAVIAL